LVLNLTIKSIPREFGINCWSGSMVNYPFTAVNDPLTEVCDPFSVLNESQRVCWVYNTNVCRPFSVLNYLQTLVLYTVQ
jgi:hypothetical protein